MPEAQSSPDQEYEQLTANTIKVRDHKQKIVLRVPSDHKEEEEHEEQK